MKAKLAFLVAAVVASAALTLTGVAMAAPAETTVTIKGPQGDFHGKVKSAKTSCVEERKVSVFKKKASGDKKIGSDTTGSDGAWSAGNTGFKNGRFYARAAKTNGCKAGTSKTIRLVDGEVQ